MLGAKPFDRAVTFDETNHHWRGAFGWHDMTRLPIDQRRALLRRSRAREELAFRHRNSNKDPAKGTTLSPPQWDQVFHREFANPELRRTPGQKHSKPRRGTPEEAPGDFRA